METESFKNIPAVHRYLSEKGFKGTEQTLRNYKAKGLLRCEENGGFSKVAVDQFAFMHLEKVGGDQVEDLTGLTKREKGLQITKLELEVDKRRKEIEAFEQGHIPRKDFERELAQRALLFKSGLRHMVYTAANEAVQVVGGDSAKVGVLISFLNDEIEKHLAQYANTKTFHVVIERGEE